MKLSKPYDEYIMSTLPTNSIIRKKGFNSFFWTDLIGDSNTFSLETRIFHCISFSIFLLCSFYFPYNIYSGHYIAAIFWVIVTLIFAVQYYISKVKLRKFNNVILGVAGLSVLIANYYSNSGIAGPTDILFPASLLLIIAVTPGKQHMVRLTINIIAFLLLHVSEYLNPQWVHQSSKGRLAFFIDQMAACTVVIFLIYFIIKYIKKNYDQEKKNSDEKTSDIEKQYECIILQNQQLEYVNAEKNKLMSIISTDLRTPLVDIQGYLQMSKSNTLNQEEHKMVENNLLHITRDTQAMLSKLLLWSKSQMEGNHVKITSINLLSVLQSVLNTEKEVASRKNIVFTYDIPGHINIKADVDMFLIVVNNLVNNAIKFTPLGGEVFVKAELVNNDCKIIFKDNGKGIDYEKQANLFSFKAESGYGTDNEKGIGLGLMLCHDFTEKQGGRIGFESVPGRGSLFNILMPLTDS